MTVLKAFLIQRILSPTGPAGFGPVIAAVPTPRIAEIKSIRAAAPANARDLPRAA